MTDEAALLAAVLANPDDDAPRLVYAAWLEENGQEERAEHIRISLEVYRMPRCGHGTHRDDRLRHSESCRYCRLVFRRHELLYGAYPEPGWVWAGEPLNRIDKAKYDYIRGMIERVEMPADALTHLDVILAAHPVREVTLATTPDFTPMVTEGDSSGPWTLRGDRTNRAISLAEVERVTQRCSFEAALMMARWPGITFHLPPGPATFTGAAGNGDVDDPRNWSEGRVPQPGDEVILTTLAPWMAEHFEPTGGGLQAEQGPGATMSLRLTPPVIRRRRPPPPPA